MPNAGHPILRGAGGYDFLIDPDVRADQAAVFWRPEECSSVVILIAASMLDDASPISLAGLPGDAARRDADDGAHIVFKDGTSAHQIWLRGDPDDLAPLAAVVPMDGSAPQRTEATLRLWRFLSDASNRPEQPPPRRIDRLVAALRAVDGRQDGASYRAIADALFDAERVAADPWKTSSLRDTVIRLARSGFLMVRGGYRRLLRPERNR